MENFLTDEQKNGTYVLLDNLGRMIATGSKSDIKDLYDITPSARMITVRQAIKAGFAEYDIYTMLLQAQEYETMLLQVQEYYS